MSDDTREQAGAHPRSWLWSEDGSTITGTYVRMDTGPSDYGERAIIVLNVDGEDRSLWLNETALVAKFRDELARRTSGDFEPGERITASRGAAKVESANGRGYWPCPVTFHDAPRRSAAEILGISIKPDAEPELSAEPAPLTATGTDDGIPY